MSLSVFQEQKDGDWLVCKLNGDEVARCHTEEEAELVRAAVNRAVK